MAKNLTKWEPNENQCKAQEYAQANDYQYKVCDLCQAVGISRQAFYLWRDDPEFCRWWSSEVDKHFAGSLDELYSGQLAIARNGAVNTSQTAAAKLLMERFDAVYAKQSMFNVPGGVSIHFHALADPESASVIDVESEPVRELVAGEDGYEEAEVD